MTTPDPRSATSIHGHVSAFFAHQPLMGLTSILLRLPFAGLASVAHAGALTGYRLGALACVLPAGLLAGWMLQRAAPTTKALAAAILAAGVVVAGPATSQAVVLGHPEEVLASTLATGAVLAAVMRRPLLAATMLGLAIGTKQWALLAAPPVLVAAGGERVKVCSNRGRTRNAAGSDGAACRPCRICARQG